MTVKGRKEKQQIFTECIINYSFEIHSFVTDTRSLSTMLLIGSFSPFHFLKNESTFVVLVILCTTEVNPQLFLWIADNRMELKPGKFFLLLLLHNIKLTSDKRLNLKGCKWILKQFICDQGKNVLSWLKAKSVKRWKIKQIDKRDYREDVKNLTIRRKRKNGTRHMAYNIWIVHVFT